MPYMKQAYEEVKKRMENKKRMEKLNNTSKANNDPSIQMRQGVRNKNHKRISIDIDLFD